jgi:ectoine hydroxylase-related dioxygenase (phytanoyl-CoA dioxygenase family)
MSKDWVLPQAGWHRDARVSVDCSIPGIQIFILIDELMPRGGGTLLRPGSHRPEWAATAPEEHNVLELFGSAGDVFFMNPAVLHAPSINANRRARLMLTARFLKP